MTTIKSLIAPLALAAGLIAAAPTPAAACPGAKSKACAGKSRQCVGKKQKQAPPARAARKSQAATLVLAVKGMTCQGCSGRVEKALSKLKGVLTASADHAKGSAVVRYNPAQIKPTLIIKTIKKLGYKAQPAGARGRGKSRPVAG